MKNWLIGLLICIVVMALYGIIGVGTRVDEIKGRAPAAIKARNWDILRYEGYQYGSFSMHGGKVWYHVRNKDNHNIQYRVFVTLWDNELQFYYKEPEKLQRLDINMDN